MSETLGAETCRLPPRSLLERLLGSLLCGHPGGATHGGGQRARLDGACRAVEQHLAAKALVAS